MKACKQTITALEHSIKITEELRKAGKWKNHKLSVISTAQEANR
jgi:hypothetical protein